MDCLQTQVGCADLDPTRRDTDSDGLHDDEGLGQRVVLSRGGRTVSYYRVSSRPDAVHSDADGIDDYREDRGWTVNVTRTASGEPLRWKPNSSAKMHVSSDPLEVDTDGDGLSDAVEKEELYTDPSKKVTYVVTRRHQEEVVDRLATAWEAEKYRGGTPSMVVETARAIGVLAPDEPGTRLAEIELADATDDFDFVQPDDGGLAFRALDRTERTDTWLANEQELRFSPQLDPWDPDTDDDGLTDGQELKWITEADWGYNSRTQEAVLVASPDWSVTHDTQPWDVDSDEDGYWDGWLGVYNASNSSNVVLYMEHLVDEDDGVTGDEVVAEQAGVHRMDAAPSAMGADIYGNDTTYHSNIHVGELQWGTDPVERADTADTGLTIEVDYYANASIASLNTHNWAEGIERNYRLYGMDVELVRDEVLNDGDFTPCFWTVIPPACVDPSDGFTAREVIGAELRHHQTNAEEYVLIVNQAAGVLIPDADIQTGVNIPANPAQAIFTEAHKDEAHSVKQNSQIELQASPYLDGLAMVTAKTEIHEIGHSFGAGAADDSFVRSLWRLGEIYSGRSKDLTDEEVNGFIRWSLMASGWNEQLIMEPMNGAYFSFSIEEASTISNP